MMLFFKSECEFSLTVANFEEVLSIVKMLRYFGRNITMAFSFSLHFCSCVCVCVYVHIHVCVYIPMCMQILHIFRCVYAHQDVHVRKCGSTWMLEADLDNHP